MNGRFLLSLVTLVILGLAASCGGDGESTATPRSAATAAPGATAAPAATAAPGATAAAGATAAPTPTNTPVSGPTPKYGGTMFVAYRGDVRCNDVESSRCSFSQSTFQPLTHEWLISRKITNTLGDAAQVVPELAESWDLSADGTIQTYHIRDNVFWHDVEPLNGRKLTADDIVWQMKRYWAASASTSANKPEKPEGAIIGNNRRLYDNVGNIEALDPLTVRVTMDKWDAYQFAQFSGGSRHMFAPPEDVETWGNAFQDKGAGTGPFIFDIDQRRVEVSWGYKKNDKYWQDGLPYMDEITILVIPDNAAQKAAFRSGQVDWLNRRAPTDVEDLRNSIPGLEDQLSLDGCDNLDLSTLDPALNDLKVRQAIHLAIDRQLMSQLVTLGTATSCGPIQTVLQYAIPLNELEQLPGFRQPKDQDIARAKELLAEAGYAGGGDLKFECINIGRVTFLTAICEVLATQLSAAIGIEVEVNPLEQNVYQNRMQSRGDKIPNFQFSIQPGGVQDTHPVRHIATWHKDQDSRQDLGQIDDELSAWIDDARFVRISGAEEAKLYRDIQDRLLEHLWQVPILAAYTYNVLQPDIKGLTTGPESIVTFTGRGLKFGWVDK